MSEARAASAPGRIRVGVAGWDYADWVGPVYPAGARPGFDRLAFVGRFVEVIEVNSTFYRPVAARTAESWLRRAPTDLAFTAKAHRSWTHEPAAAGADFVAPTLAGLRPLLEAGRLLALLVQFPQAFHREPRSLGRIDALAERLAGWPVVVEVRHAGWQSAEAHDWFARRGLGWCVVDQPRVGRTTASAEPFVAAGLGYLRLHGRNAADWFREDAGRDARYDYLYSPAELDGLAGTARALAAAAAEVVVIQNNHFRGQALANALELRRLLSGVPPRAPQSLVEAFPRLAPSVTAERDRLF